MEIKQYIIPHRYRNKYGQNRSGNVNISGSGTTISGGSSSSSSNVNLDNYVTQTQLNNRINSIEYDIKDIINNIDLNHVLLTEAEYNALPEKDDKTVYLIKGSHYILLTQNEYNAIENPDEDKIYLITD